MHPNKGKSSPKNLNKPSGSMNPQGSPQLEGSPSQHSPMTSRSQVIRENRRGRNRNNQPVVNRPRFNELPGEPTWQQEREALNMFVLIADDFINSIFSTPRAVGKDQRVPRERGLNEIQQQLGQCWYRWLPGLGNAEQQQQQRPRTIIRMIEKKE